MRVVHFFLSFSLTPEAWKLINFFLLKIKGNRNLQSPVSLIVVGLKISTLVILMEFKSRVNLIFVWLFSITVWTNLAVYECPAYPTKDSLLFEMLRMLHSFCLNVQIHSLYCSRQLTLEINAQEIIFYLFQKDWTHQI